MYFRTLWKNTIASYAGWFTNSLRRRRSVLLGLLLCALLLVVCVQYNASNDDMSMQSVQNTLVVAEVDDVSAAAAPEKQEQQQQQPVPGMVRKIPTGDEGVSFVDEPQQPGRKSRRTQPNGVDAEETLSVQPYVPPSRLVHIDFKGAPPKLLYLRKLFPLIRRFGGTGLLLEWEDMFPWTGALAPLAAGNAYSRADVRDILHMAAVNQLEVIPLIQTFGHVEFALKLPDFAHLREVQESPQALCPSYNASINFIEQMIDQVRN